ncbi:hypothetical protein TcWFU_005393 [Taenia crassiceps]|uniref:Uncharacterized protein n=1 Tax=Taenia crassiceps TaxID=6207 RepID=A0ABR4Q891_9CEST
MDCLFVQNAMGVTFTCGSSPPSSQHSRPITRFVLFPARRRREPFRIGSGDCSDVEANDCSIGFDAKCPSNGNNRLEVKIPPLRYKTLGEAQPSNGTFIEA